ncbi:decaprenyl-phosphate phosphoribosyltransferase [Nocardioides dongxiaopingii]|uniref:decaprenyl-phosphate phosphoribosyltransferase n=1 Tax=Nocardioides sp. S-1144 TaxID=2582905 RepID=UPI00110DE88E|nr:decaprenyl-phosphate phosphoribosyltransferase [Nocardioides sp. S-1144]QCW50466.1 decaprenyl-phosphate phosphoribosyltransferase [Nocardioides sp. S-1144]
MTDAPPAPGTRGRVGALVAGVRPRQWSKNLLVLGAPLMAGRLDERDVLVNSLVAVVAYCLGASGVYLVNDALDVEADRRHPVKRLRPVASGDLGVRTAIACGAVLQVLAVGAALVSGLPLAAVVASYLVISLAYSLFLKHEPVLDIAVVASGFLLRAVAGGVASGIPLSQWFLLCASFGSLFMAAGKRYAEAHLDLAGSGRTRQSLVRYTTSYLRFVWTMSAGLLIIVYSLWAFEIDDEPGGSTLTVISIAPFVLAVLRYALAIDARTAGEPEDIALTDRVLQVLAATWLVTAAGAVYWGR